MLPVNVTACASQHLKSAHMGGQVPVASPGTDPGEVKWVNFHRLPPFFFLIPQPGFGSITLLQKFTPHFKILDLRLKPDLEVFTQGDW